MSTAELRHRGAAGAEYTHPEIQPIDNEDEEIPERAAGERQGLAAASAPRSTARGRALAVAAVLLTGLLAFAGVRHLSQGNLPKPQNGVMRADQLAAFDGKGGRPVYLAIMGRVYDVTAGSRHYGPKGGYSIFAGKDASRSYVTGKFQADQTDDVADFTAEQFQELVRWRDFYATHKEYFFVAKLEGRFYDAAGNPTPLVLAAKAAAAQAEAAADAAEQQDGGGSAASAGVPCNVKWSKAEGGWVWCTDGAFPRRVLQSDWQGGQPEERCVCLESADVSDAARLYEGCSPGVARCQTSPPELAAGVTAQ